MSHPDRTQPDPRYAQLRTAPVHYSGACYIYIPYRGTSQSIEIVLLYGANDRRNFLRDWYSIGMWSRTLSSRREQRSRPRSVHRLWYEKQSNDCFWLSLSRYFYHPNQEGFQLPRLKRSYLVLNNPRRSYVKRALERSGDPALIFMLLDKPLNSESLAEIADVIRKGQAVPTYPAGPVSLKKSSVYISGERVRQGSTHYLPCTVSGPNQSLFHNSGFA